MITLKQPEEAVLANISTISEISTSNPHDLAAMQFLKEISLNCLQTKPEHRPDFSQIKSKFNACLMNGDYQELRVKDVHYMQKSEMVEEVASNLNHNNESFEGQRMETSRFTFKESQLSGHYHHDDGPASIQIPVSLFETSILNPAAKHFQTPIQAAKRRQNGGLLISVVIMIVLAAIGIILGVMLTRKPSGSNNNNLSNSVSNSTTSSTTPKSMWGGITSLSLYGLPSVDQNSIIYNMKSANLKIVRTYLKPIPFHGFGTNTFQVFDLEPGPVGVYNDTILSLYDDLMLKLYNAGIKMIINLHDRFDLGCDFSGTFYVATGAFCNVSYNTAEVFYTSEYLTSMFDARLAHILTHRNPNFDNRQWGELSEVIYSVNIQEQAQEGMLSNYTYQPDWYCQRAAKIKPLLKGVLLGTGGGKGSPDSVRNDILECSSIDVVSIFDKTYDNPTYFDEEFGNFSKIVQNFPDKQIIFENFDSCVSTDAQQQQQLEEIISRCNYYRIPWVAWAIYPGSCSVKTTSSTWTMIGQRAAEAFSLTNSSNTVVEISN